MTLNHCKIKSYIGFAIKSRCIKYGVDDILKLKTVHLILSSDSLAKSSSEKLLAFANKKNCEHFKLSLNDFLQLFDGNENVKAVAIVDSNLASAIKKNITNV